MSAFYLTSTSQQTLLAMLVTMQGNQPVMAYQNVLGPLPAVPAIPATVDENNNPVPAVPAKGVAGNYYLSINLPGVTVFPVPYPAGVTEDDANGQEVLGVWA